MVKPVKKRLLIVLFSVLIVGILICSAVSLSRAFSKVAEPLVFRDIPYVQGSTNPFQTLDVYVPKEKSGRLPLIVWIHGGAWVAGDKNHPPVMPLIERGYAVASLNYRLAQNAPHPAQINDCKSAVRWLRHNADKFNIDPNRIASWGHSAGGHLSALLGTTGDVASFNDDGTPVPAKATPVDIGAATPPVSSTGPTLAHAIDKAKLTLTTPNTLSPSNRDDSAVQAACDWAGPTNLASIASQQTEKSKLDFNDPSGPVAILLGRRSPALVQSASPGLLLTPDDAPLFIVHGDEDDVVPPAQSTEMFNKLKAAGMPADCVIEKGEGHALSSADAMRRSLDFFDKYLK